MELLYFSFASMFSFYYEAKTEKNLFQRIKIPSCSLIYNINHETHLIIIPPPFYLKKKYI